MKDQTGYVNEIKKLKEKYKNQIQIYLGVEEDAFNPLNRNDFDYIIGSCHYGFCNNNYYLIIKHLTPYPTYLLPSTLTHK